jgi:hypothetical protein
MGIPNKSMMASKSVASLKSLDEETIVTPETHYYYQTDGPLEW